MVVTSILSSDAEMIAMAGELVDATGFTDDNKTAWGIQAEAYLCMLVNYDLVSNVGSLGTKFKAILSEYVARYVAMSGVLFNMATVGAVFSSLIEPEDMVQVHIHRMQKIEDVLKNTESLTNLGVT